MVVYVFVFLCTHIYLFSDFNILCLSFVCLLILGKKMLVPLTASLYVPGTLDDADKVLVDVGTGYFIEVRFASNTVYRYSSGVSKSLYFGLVFHANSCYKICLASVWSLRKQ